jgi:outer membrane murein-binding lipoprotein Lpp
LLLELVFRQRSTWLMGGNSQGESLMKLRPVRIVSAFAFGFVLTLLSPAYAPGQPSNDIQAKAAQLERDLEETNAQVATLGQRLNEAQQRVEAAEAKIADAESRIQVAQDEITRIKSLINSRAASMYKVAGARGPLDAFNARDAKDVTARTKYSDIAANHDDALIDELTAAKQDLAVQRAEAETARAQATSERDAAANAKADGDAAASEQQRLLDQVKGEIEEALRAQTAARAAAARAAAAPQASGGDGGPRPTGPGGGGAPAASAPAQVPMPAGHGGGGAAAAYAQAQVGKAYCNTADRFGPSCYDCSGLTYTSWRAGGLEIPKVSGAQGSAYPRVDIGSLQPGDLITTSSWSAHVGIWVGEGYVHATNYGNNPNAVRYVAGTGSVVDAVRPG